MLIDTQKKIRLQTEHFSKGKMKGMVKVNYDLRIIWTGMFLWTVLTSYLLNFTAFNFWTRIIFTCLSSLFFYFVAIYGPRTYLGLVFLLRMLTNKDILEWHGCEHKVAILLHDGLEPTIENLQRISRITPKCGFELWPKLIQGHFTTREPSPEKLEAGLRLAKKYYKKAKAGSVK